MATGKLGLDKMPKRCHIGMVIQKWLCQKDMGLISWICVSIICVTISTKYHGHMNCLARGCFGGRQMALSLAYKGSGENIAQMGLASKDEM